MASSRRDTGASLHPLHDFTFRLDGVPAGIPDYEVGGWIEERLIWLPEAQSVD